MINIDQWRQIGVVIVFGIVAGLIGFLLDDPWQIPLVFAWGALGGQIIEAMRHVH